VRIDDPTIQHLLTLGLERILAISSADTYRDREALLRVGGMPPAENYKFLSHSLTIIHHMNPLEGVGAAMLKASAFFPDKDCGAEKVWRISLECFQSIYFMIYHELDWAYRGCGYVLWDQERLSVLGALKPTGNFVE
jgi:hypothetical protein